MRLGTLNIRGTRNDPLFIEAIATAGLDVLCMTETHGQDDSIHHTTSRDLYISGPRARGFKSRHNGGVRLLAAPHSKLRYRAHLRTDNAQVIVASLPSGLIVIGAYVAPLRGKGSMEAVLSWVKPWLRGEAVLLGDLNSRNRIWDTDTNAYGSTLLTWTAKNRAQVYAPRAVTCLTALGSSTVDLMVARSPRLDGVMIVGGCGTL